MKQYILIASAAAAATATLTASGVTLFAPINVYLSRGLAVAGYIGLLSVVLFFVGLAFPKK